MPLMVMIQVNMVDTGEIQIVKVVSMICDFFSCPAPSKENDETKIFHYHYQY